MPKNAARANSSASAKALARSSGSGYSSPIVGMNTRTQRLGPVRIGGRLRGGVIVSWDGSGSGFPGKVIV